MKNISLFIALIMIFLTGYYFGKMRFKDAYMKGYTDSSIQTIKIIREVGLSARDTNNIACLDFYVNKDTIHFQAWSKNIKMKKK